MTRHIPALDGIRGLAVLSVMLYHSPISLPGGFFGVDVFFVLSGFLITKLLLDEQRECGRISLRAFYVRRALRLLPALLITVCALCIGTLGFGRVFKTDAITVGRATFYTLTYVSNWVIAFRLAPWPHPMGHVWSLAIEEQFYTLWPSVLIAAVALFGNRRLLRITVGAAIAAVAWRIWIWTGAHDGIRTYFGSDTRADGLLIGCALAIANSSFRVRLHASVAWLSLAIILGCCAALGDLLGATATLYGHAVVAAMTATVIGHVIDRPDGYLSQLFSGFALRWLGERSYGLYLYHFPIFIIVQHFVHATSIAFALGFILSAVLAAVSFSRVERPILTLKKKWGVARTEAIVAISSASAELS